MPTYDASTPKPGRAPRGRTSPNPSGPTLVSTAVRCPSRAAPTATLVAVPPRNFCEGLHVLRADAGLQRVEVDADPSDGEQLESVTGPHFEVGKWKLASLAWLLCGQRAVTTLARV